MKSIFLLFAAFGMLTAQAQQAPQKSLISVTGEGTVKVQPDQVLIKSRIENEGDNAQKVKGQNDATVNNVIKFLKGEGIPEKNIHTDYITLNKNYDYNNKTYSYVANQAISIKLENLDNYEKIMSGLLEAGLNRLNGIEFKSSQIEKYQTEARKAAILDAQKKAKEYVSPINQEIGKAFSISEMEMNTPMPVYRMAEMKASADSAGQESIAPGEMEVTVKVNVSFELK